MKKSKIALSTILGIGHLEVLQAASMIDPYHPNGCRNGVRPMFKQNKRAEAKRRNRK